MKKKMKNSRFYAFTLLEVMIAIALSALGMSTLFLAQARSLELSQQARNLSVATGLARMKLLDCEHDFRKKGFTAVSDYKENGNFSDDDYPEFFWECYAYKPDIPVADGGDISDGLLGKMASDAEAAGGPDNPMASVGVGMLSPVLAQVSTVIGDSVKEMIVIVRWKEGDEYWEELSVTTHLIDMAGMQQVAAQIRTAAGALGGIPGLPGAAGGPASNPGGTTK